MTVGTSYTVTSGNGGCTSLASASLSNAAQLPTPAVPTIASVVASCSAAGSSTIANYSATNTYTFTPVGPTVGAAGVILGMTVGTSYTVTATNGGCTSLASASFSNAAQLPTPAVPTIASVVASCSAAGSSTIANYSGTNTYTFTPVGPTVGAAGVISGMTVGTSYTVTSGNGGCTSLASASFSNAAQLPTPAIPTITTTAATCSSAGSSTIANYSATNTYTFTPVGPTVGAAGVISGMTVGTSYTVTATNGGCTSLASVSFSNAAQIPLIVPTFTAVAPICSGGSLSALPTTSTNSINGTWSPALDNTTTTTYTFTPTAGQCASTATMTITVTPNVTPTFTPVAAICFGTTLTSLPSTSTDGISGVWSPALDNTTTTTYTFTPNAGQCAVSTNMTIIVNPIPTISFTLSSIDFSDNPSITVNISNPSNYLYELDNEILQESNVFYNVSYGLHTIRVYDINGCGQNELDIIVINYPKFFTPNGDGYNEYWNVIGLENQLDAKLYVFDRYGKLLKQLSTNGQGWDGTFNGQQLPSTDYWFSVEYSNGSSQKVFKAHFSLIR
jgi:gliding motility-associated-like protein